MRRTCHPRAARRAGAAVLAVVLAIGTAVVLAAPGLAQTTTPTTVSPTTPGATTAPGTPTTTLSTTTRAVTPTTAALSTTSEDADAGGGVPWVPIAVAAGIALVLVVLGLAWARRRGTARQRLTDWRARAAEVTAETGTTARLLATGTTPTGQIAQQLLNSIRNFDELARSAPDRSAARSVQRARRAVQALGLAIDADYQLRRARPLAPAEQLEASAASVRDAARETDRTLRTVYRSLTVAD